MTPYTIWFRGLLSSGIHAGRNKKKAKSRDQKPKARTANSAWQIAHGVRTAELLSRPPRGGAAPEEEKSV
jgi:hypothetical protein